MKFNKNTLGKSNKVNARALPRTCVEFLQSMDGGSLLSMDGRKRWRDSVDDGDANSEDSSEDDSEVEPATDEEVEELLRFVLGVLSRRTERLSSYAGLLLISLLRLPVITPILGSSATASSTLIPLALAAKDPPDGTNGPQCTNTTSS